MRHVLLSRISSRGYHKRILDHFESPQNVGAFSREDKNVGTGLVGAPACGDVVKLQIRVEDDTIVDACFKTFGCGSAIASSSYATELLKGKPLHAAAQVTNEQVARHLNLPPVKLHCSMLAEDGIRAAIQDYRSKNAHEK